MITFFVLNEREVDWLHQSQVVKKNYNAFTDG